MRSNKFFVENNFEDPLSDHLPSSDLGSEVGGEDDFKDTPLGSLPHEWDVVKLGDCLSLIQNGLTKQQNREKKGYPVTRIETIAEDKINQNKIGYVLDLTQNEIDRFRLASSDILFSHINSEPQLGRSVIYEGYPEFLLHGMNLLRLKTNKNLNPYYLNNLFTFYRQIGVFRSIASRAVNQSSINQGKLKVLDIPLPPPSEQRAIAHVLSTVRQSIETTERVIAAARLLKRSLMKHLFTYGPVPVEEVERVPIKETEIGKVPEYWRVSGLGECAEIDMGQSPPGTSYNEDGDGVPLINGPAEYGQQHPVTLKWTSQPTRLCSAGDIIFCVRGNTTGKMVRADNEYCIGRGVSAIRGIRGKSSTDFLHEYLRYMEGKILAFSSGGGSTFPNITKAQLLGWITPFPPFVEQEQIAYTLDTVNKKLLIETRRRASLEALFNSLLHHLMTGKVRVASLIPDEED